VTASQDKPAQSPGEFSDLITAIARDRDKAAFVRLFAFFAPRIKALMMQLGAPAPRAEEIAQDTMLAVWTKAQMFDPAGASASGWIYRIAKNLHVDGLRRDRRISASAVVETEPEGVPLPDALLSERENQSRVRAAIAALTPDQLRVVTLSFFEDKPHAEIAKELSIPLGTVKSRLRLAMQRLRDLLDSE
jgi:RNA polymerase sigma-70 factor (ECF subfamily)